MVVIVGPWFLTVPVLSVICLELICCHFSRLRPPWLSEEVKMSPPQHAPVLSLEQGAHSGQSIEEMNSSSGSCAKDLGVSWFLFLEAVHSCGSSEDILCFVRFTWTSDQYFQLCIIKVVLPGVLLMSYLSPITWQCFNLSFQVLEILLHFGFWNTVVHVSCSPKFLIPVRSDWGGFGCSVVPAERCCMCRWNKAFQWPLLPHWDVHRWGCCYNSVFLWFFSYLRDTWLAWQPWQ